jgi:hypothetical protein
VGTKTISKPPQQKGAGRYFELTFRAELNGKLFAISIDGSGNDHDLREATAYKNTALLIDAVYRFIRRTDPDIETPQLIEAN